MKKGSRRKAAHKRNKVESKPAIKRVRSKRKNLRPNPAFSIQDPATMRKMVNTVLGSLLVERLNIDFVGILERAASEDTESEGPETVQ